MTATPAGDPPAGAATAGDPPHLRPRDGERQETTPFELFFDLVYVFAVTQLSHLVIDHGLTVTSIAQSAFLLVVIWWAWLYTVWMTNWFDPRSLQVKCILTGVAVASMFMSAAIPTAFGHNGESFAAAYAGMQTGRSLFALALLRRDDPLRLPFIRLTAWAAATAPLWVLGGLVADPARIIVWGAALILDLAAPLVGYLTPRIGRSQTRDWPVEGGHFAERFQSFIIIALGESVVVTGATATSRGLDGATKVALLVAVLEVTALWWLYFTDVADNSLRDMRESDDPGRLARDAYTYMHLPIVAGIIMVAVADDRLVADATGRLSTTAVVMLAGGPALYLLGETFVRLRMIAMVSPQRLVTILALAAAGLLGRHLEAIVLELIVTATLVALAAWEDERLLPRSGPFAAIVLRSAPRDRPRRELGRR